MTEEKTYKFDEAELKQFAYYWFNNMKNKVKEYWDIEKIVEMAKEVEANPEFYNPKN